MTIENSFKNAQSTTEGMMLACTNKGLFLLDPRINKKDKTALCK